MRRETAIAVAAGVLGGLLLVAAWRGSLFGVVLGLVFSPLPLAMTALGLGLTALPLAVISGAVTVAVMTGSAALSALFVVVDAAPVAILMRLGLAAEREAAAQGPAAAPLGGTVLGIAVVSLTLTAVVVMAAGLAAIPAGTEGLEAALRARLDQVLAEVQAAGGGSLSAREAVVSAMARVLPGAAAWNWAFRALICAVMAQALLTRDGVARWPTPAYRSFAVPGWYIGVFWAAAVAAWLVPGDAGFIAANGAAVLSFPLVLQGLAVVHAAAAWAGLGRMALVAFYGVALVAAGAAIALVVMLGVMEHFLQMRARMARTPRNGGE